MSRTDATWDGWAAHASRDGSMKATPTVWRATSTSTEALRAFRAGTTDLDPQRSGLYSRFHLMVAYVLEKERVAPEVLLEHPAARDDVERRLTTLATW
jgi:hypothetical protein